MEAKEIFSMRNGIRGTTLPWRLARYICDGSGMLRTLFRGGRWEFDRIFRSDAKWMEGGGGFVSVRRADYLQA